MVGKIVNHGSMKGKIVLLVISAAIIGSTLATSGTVAAKGNKEGILTASVAYQEANVMIDGVVQNFGQSALLIDGSTMVPMRGIFEKLGAKVDWNNDTQTVTATKGDTTISLKVGANYAYVNGKYTTLTAKAEIINNSTMVPLRFISEALGANVKWDGNTNTAIINSAGRVQSPVVQGGSGQVVNGIHVQYGKHDYASANQSQYDQVMSIVNNAIKAIPNTQFGGHYLDYFMQYLDGARWNGDRTDHTDRNIGLKLAENDLKDLVSAGISKQDIIDVYKVMTVAKDLQIGKSDPGDGSPSSAYDNLVRKVSDCDSDAQVISAVFDTQGYNTAIVAGNGHADILIQVGGKWFLQSASTFQSFDVNGALAAGDYMLAQPTTGPALYK